MTAWQPNPKLSVSQSVAHCRPSRLPAELASGYLAEMLPRVIDRLTRGGQVPDADALGGLLGMLRR